MLQLLLVVLTIGWLSNMVGFTACSYHHKESVEDHFPIVEMQILKF